MQREPHISKPESRAPAPDSYVPRVRPFHIRVEQDVLDDLEIRLGRARWTRASDEAGWKRGTDPRYLRSLVAYWRVGFDWRRQEMKLGELPQYIARIDGNDVHFAHLRSKYSSATPLLLLHGWPDSFFRYHRVAPLLAAEGYDVIIPSLPGFAFTPPLSPTPRERPMRAVANVMHALMTDVLGYPQYGVVGGDGGSVIAQSLAIDSHDSVTGIHISDLGWHAVKRDPSSLTWRERCYFARNMKQFMSDGAYAMVHATRPRSLAVELADSPIGLASWILDRFHSWSDGDLDARFGKDVLLTNIMLYWVTQTIGSSIFTYYAEAQSASLTVDDYVDCPVGLALFPDDIGGIPPRRLAQRTLAVTHWTEMPRGGHFGALEEPALYARDVVAFFRSLEHG
jgi:pimeloyl-ACP methyl ester carboxylesterase